MPYNRLDDIRFFVTSLCNRYCEYCSQQTWRAQRPFWGMSKEEVRRFCEIAQDSGYHWKRLILSGGEPTIWNGMRNGDMKYLRESRLFDSIWVNSNVATRSQVRVLAENAEYIDMVRASRYPENAAQIELLEAVFQHRLKYAESEDFWEVPDRVYPVSGRMNCGCAAPAYYGGDVVHMCGGCVEAEARFGIPAPSVPLERGWMEGMEELPPKWKGCGGCVSDKDIRKILKKVPTVERADHES